MRTYGPLQIILEEHTATEREALVTHPAIVATGDEAGGKGGLQQPVLRNTAVRERRIRGLRQGVQRHVQKNAARDGPHGSVAVEQATVRTNVDERRTQEGIVVRTGTFTRQIRVVQDRIIAQVHDRDLVAFLISEHARNKIGTEVPIPQFFPGYATTTAPGQPAGGYGGTTSAIYKTVGVNLEIVWAVVQKELAQLTPNVGSPRCLP